MRDQLNREIAMLKKNRENTLDRMDRLLVHERESVHLAHNMASCCVELAQIDARLDQTQRILQTHENA